MAVARPSTGDAGAALTAASDGGLQAVCLLTSGSTGAPQPHLKRWQALVHNIAAEAERLGVASRYTPLPSANGGDGEDGDVPDIMKLDDALTIPLPPIQVVDLSLIHT